MVDFNEKELKEKLDKINSLLLKDGVFPREIQNISDEQMEEFYYAARTMYYQGKYEDAAKVFTYLNMIGPVEYRYVFGIASSLHCLGGHEEEAARAYILAASLEPKNPLPYFHVADCFIKMNDVPAAMDVLDLAIERAGNQKKFAQVKERALMAQKKLTRTKGEKEK